MGAGQKNYRWEECTRSGRRHKSGWCGRIEMSGTRAKVGAAGVGLYVCPRRVVHCKHYGKEGDHGKVG